MAPPDPSSPRTFAGHGIAAIRGERMLFSGLDFALAPGGALALSGPNGSGKSSLLRLMAGFGRPVAGGFTWAGEEIGEDWESHRARLHYVGHRDALSPALTVLETLQFWAALAASPADTLAALGAFGLLPLASLPCRFLSSGQRRRLALSRLVLWPAPLWLLDEPAVGLDVQALAALTQLIERHRAGGGSVVLATHQALDLAGVETLALADFPPRALL
jgi:heme exporter protein A